MRVLDSKAENYNETKQIMQTLHQEVGNADPMEARTKYEAFLKDPYGSTNFQGDTFKYK